MIKTTTDSIYAYRTIRLLQKPFSEWKAFEHSIIDDKGNLLRLPKTQDEKNVYTPFHATIRALKRMLSYVPSASTFAAINATVSAIGSRYSMNESDVKYIFEMVAGDAGNGSGSAKSIASGETTGDLTNIGAGNLGKVKRRKLMKISKKSEIK